MYKNIVFDVDGTLINSTNCAKAIYRQMIFEEFNKTISDAELANGMKWPTIKALEVFGFHNISDALKKYHAQLMQAFLTVNIYSGMADTLAILKENKKVLGIVTARNKSELNGDVAFQRIADNFNFIICADDTQKFKPDPEPLLLFFKQANAKPDETLYIGDTINDFLCAQNAGVHFGLALWGAETRDGIQAQYYFSKPEEILNVLD
jgi:phosphoglycolate phosphatase-like HAD superfamily hydrolase